jgi:hypothetical protein
MRRFRDRVLSFESNGEIALADLREATAAIVETATKPADAEVNNFIFFIFTSIGESLWNLCRRMDHQQANLHQHRLLKSRLLCLLK